MVLGGMFALALLGAGYFVPASTYQPYLDQIKHQAQDALYKKTIVVNGLSLLAEHDLHLERFQDWSVVSWHLRGDKIERDLATNPFISQAKLSRCDKYSWSCFKLELTERSPAFLAALQNRIWIVGNDGAFVSPLPGNPDFNARLKTMIEQRKVKSLNSSPLVSGLMPEGAASQAVKARIDLVSAAIDALKANVRYPVDQVKLQPNGELVVSFKDLPSAVTFSAPENDQKKLIKQIARFNRVMRELAGREESVEKLDLTYESFAVVSLTPGTSVEPQNKDTKAGKPA